MRHTSFCCMAFQASATEWAGDGCTCPLPGLAGGASWRTGFWVPSNPLLHRLVFLLFNRVGMVRQLSQQAVGPAGVGERVGPQRGGSCCRHPHAVEPISLLHRGAPPPKHTHTPPPPMPLPAGRKGRAGPSLRVLRRPGPPELALGSDSGGATSALQHQLGSPPSSVLPCNREVGCAMQPP